MIHLSRSLGIVYLLLGVIHQNLNWIQEGRTASFFKPGSSLSWVSGSINNTKTHFRIHMSSIETEAKGELWWPLITTIKESWHIHAWLHGEGRRLGDAQLFQIGHGSMYVDRVAPRVRLWAQLYLRNAAILEEKKIAFEIIWRHTG